MATFAESPTPTASARVPQTTADVYETMGGLLELIAAAPGYARRLSAFDLTIRFSLSQPSADMTAAFPADGSNAVEMGPTSLSPDLTVSASVATAHSFFLGTLNVFAAADSGAIRLRGAPAAVDRFVAIIPQMRVAVSPLYAAHVDGNLLSRSNPEWRWAAPSHALFTDAVTPQ